MSDSESTNFSDNAPPPQIKRGRPVGKTDPAQRTRRTAQEIMYSMSYISGLDRQSWM